jgi:hypothetical protein
MAELAYGFINYENQLADKVETIGIETIRDMVDESVRVWNEEINAFIDATVDRSTEESEFRVTEFAGGGILQPLDPDGNPRPRQVAGSYQVGLPLRSAGDAYGFNRVTRAKATLEDVNRWTLESMTADKNWVRRFLIKALLWKDPWTYVDKDRPNAPEITVKPLANGDSVIYQRLNADTPSTDNHYLAQAAVISDVANPFPAIYDDLWEHPKNNLDQVDFVVTYVASNLEASIGGLTGLYEVKDRVIIPGIQNDRVDETILNFVGFGDKVIGYIDNHIVVRWSALPSSYMLTFAPQAEQKAVAIREHPEASLKGMRTEFADLDGNHQVIRVIRDAGFGVVNRVGAVAYYIGGASYTNPPAFDPREDV